MYTYVCVYVCTHRWNEKKKKGMYQTLPLELVQNDGREALSYRQTDEGYLVIVIIYTSGTTQKRCVLDAKDRRTLREVWGAYTPVRGHACMV